MSAGPRSSPPTRPATSRAVRTRGGSTGAGLFLGLEPLDHHIGNVQRPVRGDDVTGLTAGVEDDAQVLFRADTLDHAAHAILDRTDQLLLALLGLALEVTGLLLEGLLHGLQLLLLGLLRGGAQDDRLLVVLV